MKENSVPERSENIFHTDLLFGIIPAMKVLTGKINTRINEFGTAIRERRGTEIGDYATINEAFVFFDRICEELAYGEITHNELPQILSELHAKSVEQEYLVSWSLRYGTWQLNYPTFLNNEPQEAWLSEQQKLSQYYLPVFGQSL